MKKMSAKDLEALLTSTLLALGLTRVPGPLAFTHQGHAVALEIEDTIYRGCSITVFDRGHKTSEFRPEFGSFNWSAIASAIVKVAERRLGIQPASQALARARDPISTPVPRLDLNAFA
jgi:hypothetical protein